MQKKSIENNHEKEENQINNIRDTFNDAINGFKKAFEKIFLCCSHLLLNIKRSAWRVSHGIVTAQAIAV